MIPEFIDFCKQLFPSIDPYTTEQAKRAMEQFESSYGTFLAKTSDSSDLLKQGDVFSDIPFVYINEKGLTKIIPRKAQLLSNTCDASRDDKLLFAAMHPLNSPEFGASQVDAIVKNKRFGSFYINDTLLKNEFVDFELINSVSRELFLELIRTEKVKRIASLTQIGYYMLICKMTVFFMRPEDSEAYSAR